MNSSDEIGWGARAIVIWGLAIILVLVIGAMVWGSVRSQLLKDQAEANRSSDPYITSKVTHLQTLMNEYLKLETEIADRVGQPNTEEQISTRQDQQAAILSEMKSEADLIEEQFIPQTILDFLSTHQ